MGFELNGFNNGIMYVWASEAAWVCVRANILLCSKYTDEMAAQLSECFAFDKTTTAMMMMMVVVVVMEGQ